MACRQPARSRASELPPLVVYLRTRYRIWSGKLKQTPRRISRYVAFYISRFTRYYCKQTTLGHAAVLTVLVCTAPPYSHGMVLLELHIVGKACSCHILSSSLVVL